MGNSWSADEEPLEQPLGQLDVLTSSEKEALFPGCTPRVIASAERIMLAQTGIVAALGAMSQTESIGEQEDCQRNDAAWIEAGGQSFNKLPSTGTWCHQLIKPLRVPEAEALVAAPHESPIKFECPERSRPRPFHMLPSAGTWCQKLDQPAEAVETCSPEDPVSAECLERSRSHPFHTLPSAGTWCQKLNQPAELVGISSPEVLASTEMDLVEPADVATPLPFHLLPSVGTWSQKLITPAAPTQADFFKPTVSEGIWNFDTLPSTGTWCQKRIETLEVLEGKEQPREDWNRQLSDASTASTSLEPEDLVKPPNLAMYHNSNTLPSTGTWCQKLVKQTQNGGTRPLLALHGTEDLKNPSIPEPVNDGCQLDSVKPTVSGEARSFHALPSTGTWCQPLTYQAQEPSMSDIQDVEEELFQKSEECILEGTLSVYGAAPDSGDTSTAPPEESSYLDAVGDFVKSPLDLLSWSGSLFWGSDQK